MGIEIGSHFLEPNGIGIKTKTGLEPPTIMALIELIGIGPWVEFQTHLGIRSTLRSFLKI
jgi:hypothetical protein